MFLNRTHILSGSLARFCVKAFSLRHASQFVYRAQVKILGVLINGYFSATLNKARHLRHVVTRVFVIVMNLPFSGTLEDLIRLALSFSWTVTIFDEFMMQGMLSGLNWNADHSIADISWIFCVVRGMAFPCR